MMEDKFKLNGLINPSNNNLTTEQELKRVNIVLKGLIVYCLERNSKIDNKSFDEVISELRNAVNNQFNKEDDDFKNLFT